MTEQSTPLTLSREDLYQLVWSKPMRDLAADFGISDVALAKRCRRLGIPVPGRGYWARVDAGQKVHQPSLPKREPRWFDDNALTVPATEAAADVAGRSAEGEDTNASTEPNAIQQQIAAIAIAPVASILEALPAVRRTARELKHARRAELGFDRGEKTGCVVAIEVSTEALDRALLLADLLLRASASLGWTFVNAPSKAPESQTRPYGRAQPETPSAGKEPRLGELLVDRERVGFRIEERFRDEPRIPTDKELARERNEYGYKAPRKISVATGNLRVVRLDTYGGANSPNRQSWYDRGATHVEQQLSQILLGFQELAQSIKVRRADAERRRREHEEAEQRRKEYEARLEANAKLIKQLETDAGAWHRARYLRRYIRAARRALEQESPAHPVIAARLGNLRIDFLAWAEIYVDQLDPLTVRPRAGEFNRNSHYVTDIERVKAVFARLLGSEWPYAWKLGADYTPDARDRYYAYREKSVFEVEPPSKADAAPDVCSAVERQD